MSRHRRLPGLASLCGRAFAKGAAFTVAGLLLVVGGAGVAQVQQADESRDLPSVAGPAPSSAVGRLMQRFDCSSVGYADGVTPQSALVREPDGRLQVVTFDEGWSVYTARGERQLVAVCLRPVRR